MNSKKKDKQNLHLSLGRDMLNQISIEGERLVSGQADPIDSIAPGLKRIEGVDFLEFINSESEKKQLQNVVNLLESDHPKTKGLWEKIIDCSIKSDFKGVAQSLACIHENLIRDYDPAVIARTKADKFAIRMGKHLDVVRGDGITTMRGIADKFNDLGVTSFHNKSWSHATVMKLIHRRRDMGLE